MIPPNILLKNETKVKIIDTKAFRNYGVWVSIFALIPLIAESLGFNLIPENYSQIVTGVLSILVMLGVVSNPTTENKSYLDDRKKCANCGVVTPHIMLSGQSVCTKCGIPENKVSEE